MYTQRTVVYILARRKVVVYTATKRKSMVYILTRGKVVVYWWQNHCIVHHRHHPGAGELDAA